jgi:hypothetical protein
LVVATLSLLVYLPFTLISTLAQTLLVPKNAPSATYDKYGYDFSRKSVVYDNDWRLADDSAPFEKTGAEVSQNVAAIFGSLIFGLLFMILGLAIMYFSVSFSYVTSTSIYYGNIMSMKELVKTSFKKIFNYAVLLTAMGFVQMIGFFLLIVPGIIFSIMYMFAPIIMLKENVGVFEAMRRSSALTKDYRWNLFFKGLLFMVGFLVLSLPISLVTMAGGMAIQMVFGYFIVMSVIAIYQGLTECKQGMQVGQPSVQPVTPIQPTQTAQPVQPITAL